MATLTARNPELFSADTTPQIVKQHAATSTAWNPGEFLRVNTSGDLVAISDNASTGGLQYMALTRRVSADAAGYVYVLEVTSDMVFKGHVKSGTVTAANLEQLYAIDVTSNVQTLDTADTTDPYARVVDLGFLKDPARYDSADTVAVVYFKILQSIIDAARAA